jgi:S1-C subfamily serine protease
MLTKLEKEVRGTQVRIIAGEAAGSGTIIYSKANDKGIFQTYILTCHHVIEKLISIEKRWDSALGRERKIEHRRTAQIQAFDYEHVEHGQPPICSAVPGHLIAYDQDHDMAILRAGMTKEYPHVANLPTTDLVKTIIVGDTIYACGCALALDPVTTVGILNHMGLEIDFKDYWGSGALITFGNSGGGAFWKSESPDMKFWFVGIPSRVALQGWADVANHIGFFSPVTRVYKFFEEQSLHFLIPGHVHKEADCLKEIEDRRKAEEFRLKALLPEDKES